VGDAKLARGRVRVALGGIGGDAHSIGLILLRCILVRAGFFVHYLGTQNSVTQLCQAAVAADAVLVSNMDGHAAFYLRDLLSAQAEFGVRDRLWCLGGHPAVASDHGELDRLRELGFDRVFPGYVEPAAVVSMLDEDLGTRPSGYGRLVSEKPAPVDVTVPARRSTPTRDRMEVLDHWYTGRYATNLEANAEVLRRCLALSDAQRLAAGEHRTLIQPRTGTALVSEQMELFHALANAGADVLSFQIDSLTRNGAYDEVELALKQRVHSPEEADRLNGYPAVNHGVPALRAITEEFWDIPLQVRHSARDPRLLAEISFAGGVAAFEGGPITYNLPYYRDYPPHEAVAAWRYVDMLAGLYRSRFDVVIDREFFGVLTASLVPPCLAVAVNVLEALLAAEEGVGSVSLGYAEQGNRVQDVAAIRALAGVARRYLNQQGATDLSVHTVFHQYMGAFPTDVAKSRLLLRGSAVTAGLSQATRVMLKTYVEARRIPSPEENVASLQLVRDTLTSVRGDEVDWAAVAVEEELIEREATAIVDAALRAGRGRVDSAVVEAVRRGYLDIPFSPSLWNAGRATAVRDVFGAVRFADAGLIPLPPDVREHHQRLVEQRLQVEGTRNLEEIVESDVLTVARGTFEAWPLGTA
jgi:methylaspartate mutase epsilon subunit